MSKKFKLDDIFTYKKLIYQVFMWLCLCLVSIEGPAGYRKFRTKSPRNLCGIILMVAYMLWYMFYHIFMNIKGIQVNLSLENFSKISQVPIFVLVMIFAYKNRFTHIEIQKQYVEFEKQLKSLKWDMEYRKIKKYAIVTLSSYFLTFLLLSAIRYYVAIEDDEDTLLLWITLIIPDVFNLGMRVLFLFEMMIYRNQFMIINKILMKVATITSVYANEPKETAQELKNFEMKGYPKIFSLIDFRKNSCLYIDIRTLADLHDKLCDILKKTNEMYSLPLLFMIGKLFVLVTGNLFHAYSVISEGINFENNFVIVMVLLWTVGNIGEILSLIFICSSVCYHANRSSYYVHSISYIEESKLKREIENFSMQLLHNKVEITAGGFFPIDFTLLYTIVGAVTTYLVIFVQFDLAEKARIKPSNVTEDFLALNTTPNP